MKFICYKDWYQLPNSSTSLFSIAEKDSIFFSKQWFENLIVTALKDDEKPLFACVIETRFNNKETDGQVLAILPLITRENKEWSSLSHSYSSLYSLLLADVDQHKILECLCAGIKQLPFEYLTLQPVAEDDCNINKLQQSMEVSGFCCYRHFRFYNWFHRTQGQSFSNYLADRPSRVRNTIARKQRKLERDHGYEICLYIDKDVEQALVDYHDIYKVSWKANEQYEDMVKGFTDKAAKSGWTRLAILYIEGQPVAAHLWFVVDRKASIFRLVYDQNWKQYSPGSLLMHYLMEYVIDIDKVEEIDFLTGNDRYKEDWMSGRRKRWELNCVKKSEAASKINVLTKISRTVKKVIQRMTLVTNQG